MMTANWSLFAAIWLDKLRRIKSGIFKLALFP